MNINEIGIIKASENLTETLAMLNVYNQLLLDYKQQIRAEQKIEAGSVLLRLAGCGSDCAGCPHVYWDVAYLPPVIHVNAKTKYLLKNLKVGESPLRFTRKKHFSPKVKKLIKEALIVAEQREKLVLKINGVTNTHSCQKRSNVWLEYLKSTSEDTSLN